MRLIDRVLELMEADERFVFTLDGQLQTVDDYLEIRPENEERLRALVGEGRLAVGPWQILMDEFLVCGETICETWSSGSPARGEFGGEMRVGYLPDMFGHIAQMPQILRAFGLDNAVVWRGVPAVVDGHVFEWRGIDGSSVRAEYLPAGYGNAAYLLAAPERLTQSVEALVETMHPFFGDDPVLAMYGTDHQEPVADLVEVVEHANAESDAFRIELVTLARALASGSEPRPQQAWTGEMRSGARANVLMNVTSARIDIKAAAARAERWLERYAEPFSALHGRGWPGEFLELAWRRVIENSAHDSICGCSADPVSAQVLVRFAEAEQVARDLAHEALAPAREATPRGAAVIANPSPFTRDDVVELDLQVPEEWSDVSLELADGANVATQELDREHAGALQRRAARARDPGVPPPATARPRALPPVAERLHARARPASRLRSRHRAGSTRPRPDRAPDRDRSRRERAAGRRVGGRHAHTPAAPAARPRRRAGARLDRSEGRGRASRSGQRGHGPANALENGLLRVEIADDGTLSFGDLGGVGRIVRGLDVGDSYNYGPPADDVIVDQPEAVRVEIREEGPIRALAAITRTYRWPPDHVVETETLVELRADEPFVRLRISFDNPADDQRVRVHVPLPREADRSFAEGQYAVVERALHAEGGYGEVPLPTVPRRVVRGGGRRRAPARARLGVRGARRPRARAHRPALDRADQPERAPLPRGSCRP